jgi:hypothetical protein
MLLTRRDFLSSSAIGLASLSVHARARGQDQPAGQEANLFLAGDFAPIREESTIESLDLVGRCLIRVIQEVWHFAKS